MSSIEFRADGLSFGVVRAGIWKSRSKFRGEEKISGRNFKESVSFDEISGRNFRKK